MIMWHRMGEKIVENGKTRCVTEPLQIAFKLALLTLVRVSEISGAKKEELDLDARCWIIPGSRVKNNNPHLVPLSDLAIGLVRRAIELSGNSAYLFPSGPGSGDFEDGHIGNTALYHAIQRMRKGTGLKRFGPHDLRRTGATGVSRPPISVSKDIRKALMNHAKDQLDRHYNVWEYEPEKRGALEAWSAEIEKILAASALEIVSREAA